MRSRNAILIMVALAGVAHGPVSAAEPVIGFEDQRQRLVITLGGAPLAEYVKSGDHRTSRPFFRHLHAPDGQQVSINNPPKEGEPDDHHGYHVGLAQAFGRMGEYDTWRMKDRVAFVEFVEKPAGGPGKGSFAVRNRYTKGKDPSGDVFCSELVHFTILTRPHGTLLLWDSKFRSETGELMFGDQEEMGLAIRVNAPMNVEKNQLNRNTMPGRILNSRGDQNEQGVRNMKQAEWCDYSGWVDGKFVGVTLMGHPDNFRKPWWHARDYGVLVCNPFAQNDLGGGDISRVDVLRGETFQIQYGVLLHSNDDQQSLDLTAAYRDYLSVVGEK